MSVEERLRYAVDLVPEAERPERFGRSAKQIKRYLAGDDVPFSVLQMISVQTGVPIDWIAAGRPTHGLSEMDHWRASLAPGLADTVPAPETGGSDNAKTAETRHKPSVLQLATSNDTDPGANRVGDAVSPEADPAPLVVQSRADAPPGYVAIPRLSVQASAGNGLLTSDHEQIVDHFAFTEYFLKHVIGHRPEDVTVIEARGDSMEPTIFDGDAMIVFIRPDQQIEDGQLYVVQVGDNLLVKRMQVGVLGSLTLVSDNARYAAERIRRSELDQLHVIGRVLWRGGRPRS